MFQIGKEKVKVSLFADNMIIYVSGPQNSIRIFLQLINTSSKVAGYNINSKKPVALLYTNDKWAEKEIRETAPFIIVMKVRDLYDKNFKFLKKESEQVIRRWKDLPCSWIGRINSENGHLTRSNL